MYYWYMATEALERAESLGGKSSKAWTKELLKAVLPNQRKEGHAKGSWDPVGAWGYSGGRVYSTALMALALSTEWRKP